MKVGRNDPCPCGSGKKYKKCCLALDELPLDTLEAAERRIHTLIAAETPVGRLTEAGSLPSGSQLRVWMSADSAESLPFSRTNPARDLNELLDFLLAEHRPGFLYRGQVRHYDTLIPSGYRGAMPAGCEDKALIRLDPERYHAALNERQQARFQALAARIRQDGVSLGNILAQQYGLTSESIDVTSDVRVACFFATRLAPAYEHWDGSGGNPLGVIYRFPYRPNQWDNIADLDAFLTCMCTEVPGEGPVYFPFARKQADLSDELNERVRRFILGEEGGRRVSLFSPYIVVDQEVVRHALGMNAAEFSRTRIGRQSGGFLRPPVHRVCRVAERVRVKWTPMFKVFDPPVAVGEEIQGVGNSLMLPDFEMYFFRHGGCRTDLEPEFLWPGADEDAAYARMVEAVKRDCAEYLGRWHVAVDDRERGLLDRGFLRA